MLGTRGRKRSALGKAKRPALARFFSASNQLNIAAYSSNQFQTLSNLSMTHPYLKGETSLAWAELLKGGEEGPHSSTIEDTIEILSKQLRRPKSKKKPMACAPLKIKREEEKEEKEDPLRETATDKEEDLKDLAVGSGVDLERLKSLLVCAHQPITVNGVDALQLGDCCKLCGVECLIPVISDEVCGECGEGAFWVCLECYAASERDSLDPLVYCIQCFNYYHEECDEGCRRGFSGAQHCHACRGCCRCACPSCGELFTDSNQVCNECGSCSLCHI
jgi:hypothetical protein